jgi:hypothetical protein
MEHPGTAFVHKKWAAAVAFMLEQVAGILQLLVMTVGILGFALLDLILGSFVLSQVGTHGASVDTGFKVFALSAGFISFVISAALSAAKLGAWDAILARRIQGTFAWVTIGVAIVVSFIDVIFNVAFAGFMIHGAVPMGILSPERTAIESVLAVALAFLTFFDAPLLVLFIHHLKGHADPSARKPLFSGFKGSLGRFGRHDAPDA